MEKKDELKALIDNVLNQVSGKRAWDWVSRISLKHRIQGSPGYHDAAIEILDELKLNGFDNARIHTYPANGKKKFWEWETAISWRINSGSLWIVEPKNEFIVSYDELPMSVVTHSEGCDIQAEVVDIGVGDKAEDYADADGKIVLMSGSTRGDMPTWLKQSGAIGCIIYPDEERASGYPDMVRYDGFWPSNKTRDQIQFGFSISLAQAMHLKKLMKESPIKVHAKLDAKLYDGDLEVLTTSIRGTENPDKEIILMAHLCHPAAGANDNASGSAGLIEIARSLNAMIRDDIITPPKYTIRFIWMPEFHGTVPFAKEFESTWKNAVAAINLDMIGEHPVTVGFPFQVSSAPHSTPSVLNDLISYFTTIIADHPKGVSVQGTKMPMRYRIGPFDGGSDHLVSADSYFGIPSVMFGHGDMFHHTSLDTLDKVDPTELQRIMAITMCTVITMSEHDEKNLNNVWGIIQEGKYKRFGRTLSLVNTVLAEDEIENKLFAYDLIEYAIYYEKQVIESFGKDITPSSSLKIKIEHATDELTSWYLSQKSMLDGLFTEYQIGDDYGEIKNPIYLRNFEGPLSYSMDGLDKLQKNEVFIKFNDKVGGYGGLLFELMNLMDNDLVKIASLLSLQFNQIFLPTEVGKILSLLEEIIVITKKY